jgi:integrase
MDLRAVTLIIRYKTSVGAWKRAAAVRGRNGRVRPGYALVGGKDTQVPDFQYQVRFYEGRKLRYEPAGKSAAYADALRDRIEKQQTVKAAAKSAGIKVEIEEQRKTLAGTAEAYIRDVHQRGATEAEEQARIVTAEFIRVVRKSFLDEITRDDVFHFHSSLRKRGCEERTVANKHQRLVSWLRFSGFDTKTLPPKPRYEEQLPTIYGQDEISTLLANANPRMAMTIRMGYLLGLRDQELQCAEFHDINWSENTFRVRSKPKWRFVPKTWEQRDIPLLEDMPDELKKWQALHPTQSLILGTVHKKPDAKMLRSLKRLAKRAGMNCGRCDGCHGKSRECQEFTLHKLRRTYITAMLRSGYDLRTVQAWAGHRDIKSTMRYLRPASAKEIQSKLKRKLEW